MKLTIEEANKHKCPSPVQCCASHGFIEGWNQAIETIEKGIIESQNPLSVDRESVLIFVRNLKV